MGYGSTSARSFITVAATNGTFQTVGSGHFLTRMWNRNNSGARAYYRFKDSRMYLDGEVNNIGGGTSYADAEKVAWHSSNADSHTHEVGLLEPNAWGLYDMLGNVREWCRDWWQTNLVTGAAVVTNPPGASAAVEFWTNTQNNTTWGKRS